MATKIIHPLSLLLAAGLIATVCCAPVLAQTMEAPAADPVIQRRCTMIALTSDSPQLPLRLIEPYLQQRADFQASKLALTDESESADAIVTLTRSGERDTHIRVVNLGNGQYASATSNWTDYPRMVALSIMDQLRQVCPGSIAAPPKHRAAIKQCVPVPALRSLSTVSACSQTSWMDSRDIYTALEARPELKQWSVRLMPACDGGDAVLDITHNLNSTVEWLWILRAHGNTISSGRVIAFDRHEAAPKIAASLAREIALAHGAEAQMATADNAGTDRYRNEGRTVQVLLLPTDFSVPDTRTSLYLDSERVTARDIHNRVIFNVKRGQIRDVRLRADWRRNFQLSDPTPLAMRAEKNLDAVFVNRGLDPAIDPTALKRSWLCRLEGAAWALVVGSTPVPPPTNVCPTLDVSKFALSTAGLMGYVGAGTVLAQIPTKAEVLEIAWEQCGTVKTVALQVPLLESKRLLRALRSSGSTEQEQVCSSSTLVATSQR